MLSFPICSYVWIASSLIHIGSTFKISNRECNIQTYQQLEVKASKLLLYYKLKYMMSGSNITIIEKCKKYCCKERDCKMFLTLEKACYKLAEDVRQPNTYSKATIKYSNKTYNLYIKTSNEKKCSIIKGLDECAQIDHRISDYMQLNASDLRMSLHIETFKKMQQLLRQIPANYRQCRSLIKNYLCFTNRKTCHEIKSNDISLKPCSITKDVIVKWCHDHSDKILIYTKNLTQSNKIEKNCFNLLQQEHYTQKEKRKIRRLFLVHKSKPMVRFIPANNSNDIQKGLNSIYFDRSKLRCEELCRNRGQCVMGDNTEMRCECHWPYFFNNPFKKDAKFCELNMWTFLGVSLLIMSVTLACVMVLHQHYMKKTRTDSMYGSATQQILNFVSDGPSSNRFPLYKSSKISNTLPQKQNNSMLPSNGRNIHNNTNSSNTIFNKYEMQQVDKDNDELVLYDRNQMLSNLQQLSIMNRKKNN